MASPTDPSYQLTEKHKSQVPGRSLARNMNLFTNLMFCTKENPTEKSLLSSPEQHLFILPSPQICTSLSPPDLHLF